MSTSAKKIWWPHSLYEIRPTASLILAALAAVWAVGDALYQGYWPFFAAVLVALAYALALYGGVTQQLREAYRREQRQRQQRQTAGNV